MELNEVLEEITTEEKRAVSDYKDGENDAINYLVGYVLKKTGGSVNSTMARDALDEFLEERVVDVTLPYEDYYNTSEKISEIENIPDTEQAYSTFRYPPAVNVTFEWDKDSGTLDPQVVEIGGREYELCRA